MLGAIENAEQTKCPEKGDSLKNSSSTSQCAKAFGTTTVVGLKFIIGAAYSSSSSANGVRAFALLERVQKT